MKTPKSILNKRGIRPLKRLGQSFLQDRNIMDRIVDLADIRDNEAVVEIGAGLGLMTELIARKAERVIALDIDPYMIEILKSSLSGFPNVEIVHEDILKFDFSEASAGRSGKFFKVIGNVPYYISSQILFHLLHYKKYIGSIILMFQKEVADRIVASPGTGEYGIPSVIVSMYAEVTNSFSVPPGCFYPRPKVTSCVVKMQTRKTPLIELASDSFFHSVVRSSFAQRRKTLLNNLKSAHFSGISEECIIRALAGCGIEGARRAETLSAEEFGILSNALLACKEEQIN